MNSKVLILSARLLLCMWCVFWCGFALLSAAGRDGGGWDALPYAAGVIALLGFVTWVGFRGGRTAVEVPGTVSLLVAVGYPLTAAGRFPVGTIVFMELTAALPPGLAALCLFAARG